MSINNLVYSFYLGKLVQADSDSVKLFNQPIASEGVLDYNGVKKLKKWSDLKKNVGRTVPITLDHPDDFNGKGGLVNTEHSYGNAKIIKCPTKDKTLCTNQELEDGAPIKRGYSIGFSFDPKNESGIHNNEKYDVIQSDLKIDHIAMTDNPRSQKMVMVSGDSMLNFDNIADISGFRYNHRTKKMEQIGALKNQDSISKKRNYTKDYVNSDGVMDVNSHRYNFDSGKMEDPYADERQIRPLYERGIRNIRRRISEPLHESSNSDSEVSKGMGILNVNKHRFNFETDKMEIPNVKDLPRTEIPFVKDLKKPKMESTEENTPELLALEEELIRLRMSLLKVGTPERMAIGQSKILRLEMKIAQLKDEIKP